MFSFTEGEIKKVKGMVEGTEGLSNFSQSGEWIAPNTLSRTKNITAHIKPQPVISNAEVILSAITTDLSSFVRVLINGKKIKIESLLYGLS